MKSEGGKTTLSMITDDQVDVMRLDGEGRCGWKEQYESILDPAPNTIAWEG